VAVTSSPVTSSSPRGDVVENPMPYEALQRTSSRLSQRAAASDAEAEGGEACNVDDERVVAGGRECIFDERKALTELNVGEVRTKLRLTIKTVQQRAGTYAEQKYCSCGPATSDCLCRTSVLKRNNFRGEILRTVVLIG